MKLHTVFFVFLFLSIACQAYADGVTIVTHGWNPALAGMPVWLDSMDDAIADTYLGSEKNYGKITVTKSGAGLVATCDPWNFDLTSGTSGEILVVLDWSTVANHLTGGPASQDIAAVVVDKIVNSQNGRPPLAELPIHLIGHSRGGGMICELARLLGEKGVVVDQLTPLDPHPLTINDPQPIKTNVIDAPARIYENVIFADVYLQNAEYPTGESITGAYNRTWGTLAGGYYKNGSLYPNHRNIYLMYQGTIDLHNSVNNGEASRGSTERSAWFTSGEENGEKTGFAFSRIQVAVERMQEGLHENPLLGGTGARYTLSWSEAVWPNIAALQIKRNSTVLNGSCQAISPGTQIDLRYVALDYDSNTTVTLHADSDRNPFNNNDISLISDPIQHLPTGNNFIENYLRWNTSAIQIGTTAYLYAKINDGSRTRYYYAQPCLDFSLRSKAISPLYLLLKE